MIEEPAHPPHFIKEWRQHRKLSLRKLAQRMEVSPGEEMLSHASIQRIENGLQPYTQETLHAFAHALNCEPWMLLEVNPLVDGEVVDLMSKLRKLQGDQREQAMKVLRALAG
jgi:transcriptional regulator with XRE-family HTH domain